MNLKNYLKNIKNRLDIKKEFNNDFTEYAKYQNNNYKVTSSNSLNPKIFRQTHVLEKGMSLSNPKDKFGVQKALDLLELISKYEKLGYNLTQSSAVVNAINVLNKYVIFHENRNFTPLEVKEKLKKYADLIDETYICGAININKEQLKNHINGNFEDFYKSRHSTRQFLDKKIDEKDIQKAVTLAMNAPSACNRQSCKVYFYKDKNINKQLGEIIAGNTGFDNEVENYLVVTSDISAYYNEFERNQLYVDGGIFALSLVESLHYYSIGSCILQNGEFKDKNKKIKNICGNIPENEKVVLFIAIGYYKEQFSYGKSHRKNLDEVLKIK